MNTPLPLAPQGGVLARHQAALNEGRFLIQRCGGCGQAVYFPRALCPHCGHGELAFEQPTGSGTVYAVTTVRRKSEAGGDYNVSLIELDEGVRLMSRVEGVPSSGVRIGQRVQARVVQQAGQGLVVFDLAATEGAQA